MRDVLLAQRQQRAQGAEHRVAVIRTTAAIELVAFEPRNPRSKAVGPADHLRLLVEVAVEQHGVGAVARHIDQDDRRAARQPDNFEAGAGQRGQFRPRPALEHGYGLLHITVRRPVGIEGRRFVRDLDVFGQDRNDLVAPTLVDMFLGLGDIDHLARLLGTQPLPACRMAVPWRGGQMLSWRVRLTVSPENLPVTL